MMSLKKTQKSILRQTLVEPGALYVGVGIIGATVMPHALFLGSSLASVDRLDMVPVPPSAVPAKKSFKMPTMLARRKRQAKSVDLELSDIGRSNSRSSSRTTSAAKGGEPAVMQEDDRETELEAKQKVYEEDVKKFDRIKWVKLHVLHSTIDTSYSLLGFALTINASILTLAGAAFYYGTSGATPDDADLMGAHDLIKSYIGDGAAIIFALALLCAGQSASITATLAGQIVSEGFIEWKTNPFIRRVVTRLIGMIPAAIIAGAVGAKGLNTMLVASQVLLSVVLPSVIFPLVYLCSRDDIMSVEGPEVNPDGSLDRTRKSFVSPKWATILGYLLFVLVVLANVYVIVELGLGNQ
ncbi:hypothetical protein P7C73_g1320, partial [Tremellales sp. Uapishka_1]